MLQIALEKIFSVSSKAQIMQLHLEFQTVRKSSLSMMEYIIKVMNISDNLATIGEPINERDQILQLCEKIWFLDMYHHSRFYG